MLAFQDSIWRTEEKHFDVEDFLKQYKLSHLTQPFVEGELDRKGVAHNNSGFNLLISEEAEPESHMKLVQKFLVDYSEAIKHLNKAGVPSELDFGCSLQKSDFIKSVCISSTLLEEIAKLQMTIKISIYQSGPDE